MKPAILASLGLEGAKEWRSTYSTEYEWDRHPNHPKQYLIWADFEEDKDSKEGMYIFHEVKVLDNTECIPRSERLLYVIGRVGFSKRNFDEECSSSIDSKRFGRFKESNLFEETPFFRTRMEQLLLDNK
jgi:hypothetical protein